MMEEGGGGGIWGHLKVDKLFVVGVSTTIFNNDGNIECIFCCCFLVFCVCQKLQLSS